MTVPEKEAPANSVPAAAVRQRVQALSGIIGRKKSVGGLLSLKLNGSAQPSSALDTGRLECVRGYWNSRCSGGIRRYREELRRRRRVTGAQLTLRDESVGSKKD